MDNDDQDQTEIEDLRNEFKDNKRYLQFIDDMVRAGIHVRDYSGRGMYGKRCPAASTSDKRGVSLQDIMGATKVKLTTDSMGLGVVCYVR